MKPLSQYEFYISTLNPHKSGVIPPVWVQLVGFSDPITAISHNAGGSLSQRLCTGTGGHTAEECTVVDVSCVLEYQMVAWLIFWSSPNLLSAPLPLAVLWRTPYLLDCPNRTHINICVWACLGFDLWWGSNQVYSCYSRGRWRRILGEEMLYDPCTAINLHTQLVQALAMDVSGDCLQSEFLYLGDIWCDKTMP